MKPPPFRWGILGTAQIARKNWQAIRLSGNGIITAVASRDLTRARRFLAECQAVAPFTTVPRAYGCYEDLLADPAIDGVYIPLPTGVRKEWVLRAARTGKPIVCEKPCAANVADLVAVLAACRRHRVQFLDGVMFMHSRRLDLVRRVLDDKKTVGPLRRLHTHFSFPAPAGFLTRNIRAQGGLEPLGCLGDLGWYCLRLALWALRWEMPERVTGRVLLATRPPRGQRPVPLEFSGELFFAGGVSSSFYCSFVTANQQTALLSGTRGVLAIDDFVLPQHGPEVAFTTRAATIVDHDCERTVTSGLRRWTVAEHGDNHPTAQESYLFRHFAAQVQTGRLNKNWPAWALATQRVVAACLASAQKGGAVVRLRDSKLKIENSK